MFAFISISHWWAFHSIVSVFGCTKVVNLNVQSNFPFVSVASEVSLWGRGRVGIYRLSCLTSTLHTLPWPPSGPLPTEQSLWGAALYEFSPLLASPTRRMAGGSYASWGFPNTAQHRVGLKKCGMSK